MSQSTLELRQEASPSPLDYKANENDRSIASIKKLIKR